VSVKAGFYNFYLLITPLRSKLSRIKPSGRVVARFSQAAEDRLRAEIAARRRARAEQTQPSNAEDGGVVDA
jgi:hypothetical protein